MPRPPASLLALGLGAASAVALVACGSENARLLPGTTAREIVANLETVKQLADEEDCVGAESAAGQVSEQIEELGGIDAKLKRALQQGAGRLSEVVASCEESATEAIAPAEIPAETEEEKPSKAEKREEKETAKEEKAAPAPEEAEGSPQLPPQAKGKGKGLENGKGTPEAGGEEGALESPSGGVSSGSPAGGGE